MVPNPSAPNLNKFSKYRAGERYTILGKRKYIDYNQEMPASNKYDCRGHVERTSKYRAVSQPCGFSKANRWGMADKNANVTAGPGELLIILSYFIWTWSNSNCNCCLRAHC